MSLSVGTPCSGKVVALSDVPDSVFAAGILGAGLAIAPDEDNRVLCPVSGHVLKVMPHAFIIEASPTSAEASVECVEGSGESAAGSEENTEPAGVGPTNILVHLGLDSVHAKVDFFEPLLEKGQQVEAGQLSARWDPARVAEAGISNLVVVVAMGTATVSEAMKPEDTVKLGDVLFSC